MVRKSSSTLENPVTSTGWGRSSQFEELGRRSGVSTVDLLATLAHAEQIPRFYDVKQWILPLPIGGNTATGQKLKSLVLERIELEDLIPKVRSFAKRASHGSDMISSPLTDFSQLKAELPSPELDEIASGKYYFNLHIVTGRKPPHPRPGDLLGNGTRQEMTASTYNAMARLNDAKSSQWKR